MPRERPKKPRIVWRRGAWDIEYYDGDSRKRIATGTADEQGALRALADFEDKRSKSSVMTLAQALDQYEKDREGQVAALGRLRDASNALKGAMGHLRLDQITQERWKLYASGRMTKPRGKHGADKHVPKPVSSGTLRREFNVLRAALRRAWKEGHLAKPPSLEAPSDTAPRDRYLTKQEARALLDACVTPHVKVFIALALYTGARKGSILELSWDRVNFESGMVDFQEPGRKLTGKRRAIVPMNKSLRAILEEAHKVRRSGYVVEFGGNKVPTGLRWSFQRLCVRAGLTWRPTPHHLKHSVISWLAMEHIPIEQAADLVATDPATLRRVYRKFDPAYLRNVTDALEL